MVQLNITLTKEQLQKIISGESKVYKQKLTVQHSLEEGDTDKYSSRMLSALDKEITINPTDVVIVYPKHESIARIGSVNEPITLEVKNGKGDDNHEI